MVEDAHLPKVLVLVMCLIARTSNIYQGPEGDLDALELFAGDRAITRALRKRPPHVL